MRVAGSPSLILLGRYVLSAIISIAILMRFRNNLGNMVRTKLSKILASGAFNMGFVVCMYYALLYIPSGPVSAIIYTYPLMILLISSLAGYSGISSKTALGSLIAFVGVLTIYAPSQLDIGGTLLSLLAAVFFSISSVISSRIPIDLVALTAIQNIIGLPIAVAIYILTGSSSGIDVIHVIAIVHQGFGASFLAYIAWYRLLTRSIGIASSIVYMVPAAAYIMAIPIAGETPTLYQILGLVLVLIGIYIARRKGS
ncbi:MAG TPA: DMT family transporter [Sulfolobales archaeon]|nr:DMT family transporter [Sulfolobales archaeon]